MSIRSLSNAPTGEWPSPIILTPTRMISRRQSDSGRSLRRLPSSPISARRPSTTECNRASTEVAPQTPLTSPMSTS